jgi:hypothetical protein
MVLKIQADLIFQHSKLGEVMWKLKTPLQVRGIKKRT